MIQLLTINEATLYFPAQVRKLSSEWVTWGECVTHSEDIIILSKFSISVNKVSSQFFNPRISTNFCEESIKVCTNEHVLNKADVVCVCVCVCVRVCVCVCVVGPGRDLLQGINSFRQHHLWQLSGASLHSRAHPHHMWICQQLLLCKLATKHSVSLSCKINLNPPFCGLNWDSELVWLYCITALSLKWR